MDGYGNVCDGDFDRSTVVAATDFHALFLPDFASGVDSGVGTDMDCNSVVNASDFSTYSLPAFTGGARGPFGLACASVVPCNQPRNPAATSRAQHRGVAQIRW